MRHELNRSHSDKQRPCHFLRAFAYEDERNDIDRDQLDYDVNGLVLHSSLVLCGWCMTRVEFDSEEEVNIVREVVEHIKAVMLWRPAKDQVITVTLAIIQGILRGSYLARKAFCEGGGVRVFLVSLQWLSMPTLQAAIPVLASFAEYPRLINEVKASSGYERLMNLAIKVQRMPRDIASWLGDFIVHLAGSRGDGDHPEKAREYGQLLISLVNHEVTSISPFVLTCLWRMCLQPKTNVMLIDLGCVEALLIYLKRALVSPIEGVFDGATNVAVGLLWRLLADSNMSTDSQTTEVLDILFGILRVRSKRATSELRKVCVEMAWYMCVSDVNHKEHAMRRGVQAALLKLMLDLDEQSRVPSYLRVAAGGFFMYMYLHNETGAAFRKVCGEFGRKVGLLEIFGRIIQSDDRECQVFAAKSVGYLCVTSSLRARAREIGVVKKLVPFAVGKNSTLELQVTCLNSLLNLSLDSKAQAIIGRMALESLFELSIGGGQLGFYDQNKGTKDDDRGYHHQYSERVQNIARKLLDNLTHNANNRTRFYKIELARKFHFKELESSRDSTGNGFQELLKDHRLQGNQVEDKQQEQLKKLSKKGESMYDIMRSWRSSIWSKLDGPNTHQKKAFLRWFRTAFYNELLADDAMRYIVLSPMALSKHKERIEEEEKDEHVSEEEQISFRTASRSQSAAYWLKSPMRDLWNYPFPASPIATALRSRREERPPFKPPFASPCPPPSPSAHNRHTRPQSAKVMPYTPPRATVRSATRSVSRKGEELRLAVQRNIWAPKICSIRQEEIEITPLENIEKGGTGKEAGARANTKHHIRQRPQSAMSPRSRLQGPLRDSPRAPKLKPEKKKQTRVQVDNEGNLKTFTFGPTSHPGPSATKLFRWQTVEGSKVGASLFPAYTMAVPSSDDRSKSLRDGKKAKNAKMQGKKRYKTKKQKMHFCLERDYHEAVLSLDFDSPTLPTQLSQLLVFEAFGRLSLSDEARDMFAEVASSPFDFVSLLTALTKLGARFQHRLCKESRSFVRRLSTKDLLQSIEKDDPLEMQLELLGGFGGGECEDDEDPWIAEASVFLTKGVKDWG